MTAKQTAIRNVIKLIATALVVGLIVGLLVNTVPLAYIGIGACVIMLGYLVKFVYEVELDKAERLEKLNKMVDKV